LSTFESMTDERTQRRYAWVRVLKGNGNATLRELKPECVSAGCSFPAGRDGSNFVARAWCASVKRLRANLQGEELEAWERHVGLYIQIAESCAVPVATSWQPGTPAAAPSQAASAEASPDNHQVLLTYMQVMSDKVDGMDGKLDGMGEKVDSMDGKLTMVMETLKEAGTLDGLCDKMLSMAINGESGGWMQLEKAAEDSEGGGAGGSSGAGPFQLGRSALGLPSRSTTTRPVGAPGPVVLTGGFMSTPGPGAAFGQPSGAAAGTPPHAAGVVAPAASPAAAPPASATYPASWPVPAGSAITSKGSGAGERGWTQEQVGGGSIVLLLLLLLLIDTLLDCRLRSSCSAKTAPNTTGPPSFASPTSKWTRQRRKLFSCSWQLGSAWT
jgi:hypothetical protein